MNPLRHPSSIDDLLLYRLSRLLSLGGSPVIRLCEGRFGITRSEWRVIASLHDRGRMASSALALHIQLDRARTSRRITSLVAKGLLNREPVPGDQRRAMVSLTEKGKHLYEGLFPKVVDLHAQLVSALTDDELAGLDKALSLLHQHALRTPGQNDLPKANRRRGTKVLPP